MEIDAVYGLIACAILFLLTVLAEHGFDREMWMVVKHTPDSMTIQHRETGKIKHINLREDRQ